MGCLFHVRNPRSWDVHVCVILCNRYTLVPEIHLFWAGADLDLLLFIGPANSILVSSLSSRRKSVSSSVTTNFHLLDWWRPESRKLIRLPFIGALGGTRVFWITIGTLPMVAFV